MRTPGCLTVPLQLWAPPHPAALEQSVQSVSPPPAVGAVSRSPALAEALAARNTAWGNQVAGELERWLGGAEAVVAGQQPGLLGGPLLTLVKACAVAAEVRRRREVGRQAVGFLWLASNDDDLPEMGWGRVVVGEDIHLVREQQWRRGEAVAGHVLLGRGAGELLGRLTGMGLGERAREALALATQCYRPGVPLSEATARFLASLVRGLGVVLVDGLEPALAVAARPVVAEVLNRLPLASKLLLQEGEAMRARGWPVPLSPSPTRLPVFRLRGGRRERLVSRQGYCPASLLQELEAHPQRFSPNVWLRPLFQDAALGTHTALLGAAEMAYHLQARGVWELAALPRPLWRLRPHVTVVTSAERRLAAQLRLDPEDLLARRPPRRLLPGGAVSRQQALLLRQVQRQFARLAETTQRELPVLGGDVQATATRVAAALKWLEHRTLLARTRTGEVELGRWRRLQVFLRPDGQPQERRLSVLAPLLRLGLEWPAQLAAALDPEHPGMHLMCWEEGGPW